MYQAIKNLTANQQIAALFVAVFGFLLLASIITLLVSLREHGDDEISTRRRHDLRNVEGVLKTSWLMALVFWLGWVSGNGVALLLFGFVSFFALREFMTLSPTRRGDHRGLILAFFVILPMQYWLIGNAYDKVFTVFVPVVFGSGCASCSAQIFWQGRPNHHQISIALVVGKINTLLSFGWATVPARL